jgi:hypothetical protein
MPRSGATSQGHADGSPSPTGDDVTVVTVVTVDSAVDLRERNISDAADTGAKSGPAPPRVTENCLHLRLHERRANKKGLLISL